MSARYYIRLKDAAGNQVAQITEWRTLTYTKRVNGLDTHNLVLDGELAVVDLFELDGQVEIFRRDIDASPEIPWYLDYEGFHRTEQRETDLSGLSTFTSVGTGYDSLLARRFILHQPGSSEADKSGVGETVIKAYVDENMGPGATAPPRLFDGRFTGVTVQVDGAAGSAWEGSRAYRSLLETLKEIADATSVDFATVGNGPALFEFQAQATPIGNDRSVGNAPGNPPVVFSLDFGNMQAPTYVLNRQSEVTAAIVLGQGISGNRDVVQRTSAALTTSTWNRIESVRNANQNAASAGLNAVGDAMLEKFQAREMFGWEFLQIPGLLLGRDYFHGDIVTARYKTIERNKQIILTTVLVDGDFHEDIAIELGDVL